jgi:hypothetical protein
MACVTFTSVIRGDTVSDTSYIQFGSRVANLHAPSMAKFGYGVRSHVVQQQAGSPWETRIP